MCPLIGSSENSCGHFSSSGCQYPGCSYSRYQWYNYLSQSLPLSLQHSHEQQNLDMRRMHLNQSTPGFHHLYTCPAAGPCLVAHAQPVTFATKPAENNARPSSETASTEEKSKNTSSVSGVNLPQNAAISSDFFPAPSSSPSMLDRVLSLDEYSTTKTSVWSTSNPLGLSSIPHATDASHGVAPGGADSPSLGLHEDSCRPVPDCAPAKPSTAHGK